VFPTYAKWEGNKPLEVITFNKIGNNGKSYSFKSQDWVRFLGWYISEGSRRNSLKGGYRIYISQKNEEGRNEIRDLLDKMAINYYEGNEDFVLASKPICEYLGKFGIKADCKELTPELKTLDIEHLEILLDSLVAGDGTWYKRGYQGHFVSSSKKLADDVMEIAIKCGYRASITEQQGNDEKSPYGTKPRYHVSLYNKQGDTRTRNIKREKYCGDVYCLTVPPHHTVLIRHKGKTMWTGQSQQFDILLFDEMTQFSGTQIRYLLSRNRATKNGVVPFTAGATNPGGIGHLFFKEQFVDPGEPEQVHDVEVEPGIFEKHIFVPARLEDNQILERRDPGYRAKLEAQPEEVRRALLYGDFDVYSGRFFTEYDKRIHVIPSFQIPVWWKRARSLDYGLDMTACIWWAISDSGQCYAYRELHQPGLNLTMAAKKIVEMTPADEHISYTTASPDLWNRRQETGASGMELMSKAGLKGLVKARHDRIQGWRVMREHLQPYEIISEDGGVILDEYGNSKKMAQMQIFENCKNMIKYIPLLQHDEHNVEDASNTPHIVSHINESCLTGDTIVNTVDGDIPIKELVGKSGQVYCFNLQNNSPVIGEFSFVHLARSNAEIYEVELEDGRIFKGTPDHKVLTQCGWREIQYLLPGDDIVEIGLPQGGI
jgi:phage terminase large subunit